MGRLANQNQIQPIPSPMPSPTLSWPPANERRNSLVFGGQFQKLRMKRRLKIGGSAQTKR